MNAGDTVCFFASVATLKRTEVAALLRKGDMATLYYACYLEMLAFIGMNVGKVKGTSFLAVEGHSSCLAGVEL